MSSVVMVDGGMRLELSRWDEAELLGVCRECVGPIGGWPETAPFFVVGTETHWHHLNEEDTLDGHEAWPIEGETARFEGSVWCGRSGTTFIRSWKALAFEVDRWARDSGMIITWGASWRDASGRMVCGVRGEVAGCDDVAHHQKCEAHKMTSCGICHSCPPRS